MKLDFPATQRNKDYITDTLTEYLPDQGNVLEIASGSGQHICHFAEKFPNLNWIPSDPEAEHRQSIDLWAKEKSLSNVSESLNLNAQEKWEMRNVQFLVCINMIHISPFEATIGLFENAKNILSSGECLFLYGPYLLDDIETSQSNLDFDRSLRSRNKSWGIRQLNDVKEVAANNNFVFKDCRLMPANNYSVIFQAI